MRAGRHAKVASTKQVPSRCFAPPADSAFCVAWTIGGGKVTFNITGEDPGFVVRPMPTKLQLFPLKISLT